ncbi:hypothetical protein MMC13_003642 [Lambiella insularis]|nr:hypothetical protein [Lambiella insularis]
MQTRFTRTGARRTGLSRRRISYRESSSEGSAYESPDELYSETIKPIRSDKSPSSTTRPKKRKPPTTTATKQPSPKKVKLHILITNALPSQLPITEPSTSPPWKTLPYAILTQIFQYASYPLCDSLFQPTSGITWLSRTALICKSFTEPAISALYYSPPLYPPSRAQGLLAQLASQSSTSTCNYRSKVKYLEIEATSILLHKHNGVDPIRLEDLIQYTPQLRGIGIHLLSDQPQYRTHLSLVNKRPGVVYKKTMFDALRDNKIRLLKWKWNLNFNRPGATRNSYPWSVLKDIHSEAPFQSLRSLSIVKYESKQAMTELELAAAIKVLPNLKRLNLESWATYSGKLLPLLPHDLESLRIASCSSLTSDLFQAFILTHGNNFRELILDHNQSLDLAFLVDLAASCPLLESFSMNMTFFSPYSTSYDAEPKFGALLLPGQTPTWPSTLKSIELIQLRKWKSDSAEAFFTSLVHSAPEMMQLRRLLLKASIDNIGWRDRATFRDRWIGRLQKVFLRRSLLPISSVYPTAVIDDKETTSGNDKENQHPLSRRSGLRSSRNTQADQPVVPRDLSDTESDSDAPIAPFARRSKRLMQQDRDADYNAGKADGYSTGHPTRSRSRKKALNILVLSDEDDAGSQNAENVEDEEPAFIQGMCDVVDIRIDNLRPAENQYNENDFLDEEPSGDEDWNGDDGLPGDGGYAW